MSPICDVIVLTWNRRDVIEGFVGSLLANTVVPTRLIIIDNGSSDGTGEYLSSLRGNGNCLIKVVLNDENKGFVRGMNQGIEMSDAPYVCLANNDIMFSRGWLKEIVSIFKRYPEVGLLNPNSNNLGMCFAGKGAWEEFAASPPEQERGVFAEMPFCIAFCLVIRREVIDKIGGLSLEFAPMFFEDTDYSLRVAQAGYRIGVAKGAYVYHKEHGSFAAAGDDKIKALFADSEKVFFKKWGKILRIAWVVGSEEELREGLEKAKDVVRRGNFIWVLGRGLSGSREAVFRRYNSCEHSGINFVNSPNSLLSFFRIVVKKKRYDLIITPNRLLGAMLRCWGYKVTAGVDTA